MDNNGITAESDIIGQQKNEEERERESKGKLFNWKNNHHYFLLLNKILFIIFFPNFSLLLFHISQSWSRKLDLDCFLGFPFPQHQTQSSVPSLVAAAVVCTTHTPAPLFNLHIITLFCFHSKSESFSRCFSFFGLSFTPKTFSSLFSSPQPLGPGPGRQHKTTDTHPDTRADVIHFPFIFMLLLLLLPLSSSERKLIYSLLNKNLWWNKLLVFLSHLKLVSFSPIFPTPYVFETKKLIFLIVNVKDTNLYVMIIYTPTPIHSFSHSFYLLSNRTTSIPDKHFEMNY